MRKERHLKVIIPLNILPEMIFSEDAILQSLLERFEDEADIKEAVLKYLHGGAMEAGRPEQIEAVKADASEVDIVRSS